MKVNAEILDYFDIIENDDEKEYGYATIFAGEGYAAEGDEEIAGWETECYKYRLPTGLSYEKAVENIEQCENYSEGFRKSLLEAYNDYLSWWCEPPTMLSVPEVNIISTQEADELIKNGFEGKRILIRVCNDPYIIKVYGKDITSEPGEDIDTEEEFFAESGQDLKNKVEWLIRKYEGRWYEISAGFDEVCIISGVMDPDDIYSICEQTGVEAPPKRIATSIDGLVIVYYNDGSGYAEYKNKKIAHVDLATREYKFGNESWLYDSELDKELFLQLVENFFKK